MKNQLGVMCACIIGVLLIAPGVDATILSDPDTTVAGSGVNFTASAGSTNSTASTWCDGDDWLSYGGAAGSMSLYTTEAGSFNWQYSVYNYAYVELILWDDQASYAEAWAEVEVTHPDGVFSSMANPGLSYAGTDGGRAYGYREPLGSTIAYSGVYTDSFDAMEGINAENSAVVYVSTHNGGDDYGYAYAHAYATPEMW